MLASSRLVTMTGAGGVGKTRLAIRVAEELSGLFPDGVWVVELAPLANPALMPQAIASVLGVRERPDEAVLDSLLGYLQSRNLLLVVDNCEHLIEACARLVDRLLRESTHLKVLATSRQPIGLTGELTWRVPCLSVPGQQELACGGKDSPSRIMEFDAVRLFVNRAVQVNPEFRCTSTNAVTLARICRSLDGIPLAIELAAARMRAMSAQQILERLADRFGLLTGGSRAAAPRQQTLRAALDWSYGLLPAAARTLLARLSVFAGGWTLAAAEAVCADEVAGQAEPAARTQSVRAASIDGVAVLDLLTSLVDQSLISYETRNGAGRYVMLETVREYSRAALEGSGEGDQLQDRQLQYFSQFASLDRLESQVIPYAEWEEQIELEHDNLRAAFRWARSAGREQAAMTLAGALWGFWRVRSDISEGREWLAAVLSRPGSARGSSDHARALNGAGMLAIEAGDLSGARTPLEESLSVARALGDGARVGDALDSLAYLAACRGDRVAAGQYYQEALDTYRAVGNRRATIYPLNGLGEIAALDGEFARARAFYRESIATCRETGSQASLMWAHYGMGTATLLEGDLGEAHRHLQAGLAIAQDTKRQDGLAWCLHGLATLAHREGDLAGAESYYLESLRLFHGMGRKWQTLRVLDSLAALAFARGLPNRAARLLGTADGVRETTERPVLHRSDAAVRTALAALRAALADPVLSAHWQAGRRMSLGEAVAEPPNGRRDTRDEAARPG